MPTWLEHLNAALDSNCHRIADLCEIRVAVEGKLSSRISSCRSLDDLLRLELARRSSLDVIDAEIELLSRGSRKLMSQMAVAS